jgi:hypothetical protein
MKHPRRRVRRLKQELQDLRDGYGVFYRQLHLAGRAMSRLEPSSVDRSRWTLAHRIQVYDKEQQLQPQADKTGKRIIFVCAAGLSAPWDELLGGRPMTVHQHTVYPTGWEGARETFMESSR